MGMLLDDFVAGQVFSSPTMALESEVVASFPDELGTGSTVASAMAVASLTMRLIVESGFRPEGGIMGAGIEELEWPHAARIGDRLRLESEVLEVRRSQKRPEKGLLRVRNRTLDESGRVVQSMISTVVVPTGR